MYALTPSEMEATRTWRRGSSARPRAAQRRSAQPAVRSLSPKVKVTPIVVHIMSEQNSDLTRLRTNFLSAVSLITWLSNYFESTRQGTLAVISSVAGDRGRKSNYVYGASKGALNIFLDGVRNRVDRAGVQVLTIRPGFVSTPMTAHLPQGPLFASPARVADGILKAIAQRKDVLYVPGFWALIMWVIRNIPQSIFKKLNL